MTIESAIFSIHDAGFRVLNLFELRDGTWQANVCDDEKAWEFGIADNPELALITALDNVAQTPGSPFIKGRTAPDTILDDLF